MFTRVSAFFSGACLLVTVCGVAVLSLAGSSLHAQVDPAAKGLLLDAVRSADKLFAVGERGTLLRSVDSGRSWERIVVNTSATLTAISFAPHSLDGWVVGHDATLLATHDGGMSWNSCYRNTDLSQSFLDVLALDSSDVIAVGAFGLAVATHDGGRTWLPLRIEDGDSHLNAITRIRKNIILVVGEAGFASVSKDAGLTWNRLTSPYSGSFFGARPYGEEGGLVVGLRGHLYLIDDLLHPKWMEVPTPAGTGLLATAIRLHNGTWVAAGRGRSFLVSRDEGRSFKAWDPGLTSAVQKLLQAPDGSLLAFGEDGVSVLPTP